LPELKKLPDDVLSFSGAVDTVSMLSGRGTNMELI
jgi:hypothetical protein